MEHSPYQWKYFWNSLHYVQVETSRSVAEIEINYRSSADVSYHYDGDTYFDLELVKAHVEAKIARNNAQRGIVPR